MKKKGLNKLSLDKVKIAQLNNTRAIVGGSLSGSQQSTLDVQTTVGFTTVANTSMTSTKTGAVTGTSTVIQTGI